MASQKIAVYSISGEPRPIEASDLDLLTVVLGPDLKNTTDDALPNYLNSLKFKQSHYLTDVRLALGYSAVLIAAATFAADYKLGWDATKAGTFWAVLVYFVLNGALTIWIWQVEKGVVYRGEKDGFQLSIASTVAKFTPIYHITVRTGNEVYERSAPFSVWFDVDGQFVAGPFQQWLASSVPAVGQADPGRASAKTDGLPKENGQSASIDAVTPSPKKRGRPRKE